MHCWNQMLATKLNKSMSVVRIAPTDDNDSVHTVQEFEQRPLPKLRWLADRID